MYEYGFRDYDAQLARWHVVDPSAESYIGQSPYHFAGNSPVNNIELNGADYYDYGSSIASMSFEEEFAEGMNHISGVSEGGGVGYVTRDVDVYAKRSRPGVRGRPNPFAISGMLNDMGEIVPSRGSNGHSGRMSDNMGGGTAPPDDYWTKDGKYLGTIEAKTDVIRIISQETWNGLQAQGETNNDEYASRSDGLNTVLGTTDETWKKIFEKYMDETDYVNQYFFESEITTEEKNEPAIITQKIENKIIYKVLLHGGVPRYFSSFSSEDFTVSNVKNVMGHEWYHGFQRTGGVFDSRQSIREIQAIKFQQSLPSWKSATEAFKTSVIKRLFNQYTKYLFPK
jgi:hypothetical protein